MDGYPPPERKGRRNKEKTIKNSKQNPLKYSVGVEVGGGVVYNIVELLLVSHSSDRRGC